MGHHGQALRLTNLFNARMIEVSIPAGIKKAVTLQADNVAKARALLNVPKPDAIPDDPKSADAAEPPTLSRPCPCCGGRMLIIETFKRGCEPPATAPLVIRIDTS
jgi:hypothetical protein